MNIIDAHAHIPNVPNYVENLIKTLDECNIEKCCISGLGKQFKCVDNEGIRRIFTKYPDRFIGAYFIRPGASKPEEIESAYADGFKPRFVVSFSIVLLLSFSNERLKKNYQQNLLGEKEKLHHKNEKLKKTVDALETAERTLKESEEKYRDLVERANDGIVLIQNGLISYVNPRMAHIIGYASEDLIDQPFIAYVHPQERATLEDRYRRRMQGSAVKQKYETKLLRRDGNPIEVEVNAGLIPFQHAVNV